MGACLGAETSLRSNSLEEIQARDFCARKIPHFIRRRTHELHGCARNEGRRTLKGFQMTRIDVPCLVQCAHPLSIATCEYCELAGLHTRETQEMGITAWLVLPSRPQRIQNEHKNAALLLIVLEAPFRMLERRKQTAAAAAVARPKRVSSQAMPPRWGHHDLRILISSTLRLWMPLGPFAVLLSL